MTTFSMIMRIILLPAFLLWLQMSEYERGSIEGVVVSMTLFVIIVVNLATAEIKEEIREQSRKR